MKALFIVFSFAAAITAGLYLAACSASHPSAPPAEVLSYPESAQAPTWSKEDMQTFLHGSMSTEFVPETVLRAFIQIYPDLFPTQDFSQIGAIADPAFGWPVGFAKGSPEHLGGLPSLGINCAACHVAEIRSPQTNTAVRVLGGDSHFDAEGLFGSVLAATWRTADPKNMKLFLAAYLDQCEPEADAAKRATRQDCFNSAWQTQAEQTAIAMATDPAGARNAGPGGLQKLAPDTLQLTTHFLNDPNFPKLTGALLKLFHNMRTALHVPDAPPTTLPPTSGPGRNDAFGLLSAALFKSPQPFAPVKFGFVWNVEHRRYVHWDANTQSPIARNLLAAVGLGAPLIGHHAQLDFKLIEHQTALTEKILPPRYPFAIDAAAAKRGAPLYQASCASCHDAADTDARLYPAKDLGTDPLRARLFTQAQADQLNQFLATLETPGYTPPASPGIRSTGKYWAVDLAGVWARSPYLHNGSVRTMAELLSPPASRPETFRRGSKVYDPGMLGFTDAGSYLFNAKIPGNSNGGHDYGTALTADEKHDLIEYLKTQ